ncbi:MAG: RNA polymerase sigma factor [Eubacterium sp.]|nr:RNA polymerase sigma factor [Eubacterium sp.]
MKTDAQLVRMWKQGDRSSFDLLYEKYKNLALRTAYLICRKKEDSEDILQETFVLCHLHIEELKKEGEFKSWMLRILVREAYRMLKEKQREIPDEEIGLRLSGQTVPDILDQEIARDQELTILSAIDQLSPNHRLAVILYYYDELSVKEIARVTGCLEGTVKSRLYFARRKLRSILEKEADYEKRWIGPTDQAHVKG